MSGPARGPSIRDGENDPDAADRALRAGLYFAVDGVMPSDPYRNPVRATDAPVLAGHGGKRGAPMDRAPNLCTVSRMRAAPLLALLVVACAHGERSSEVAPLPASASTPRSPVTSVWPDVPTGTTPDGATWQTIRERTIQVHVALPPGFTVERTTLPFGHPVVYLVGPTVRAEITYSSGPPRFAVTGEFARTGLVEPRLERTDVNITLAHTRQGARVVTSWVRGAQCEVLRVTPANEEVAFRLCASLRVPPPGPLRAPPPGTTLPPLPEGASVATSAGTTSIHAGHFTMRVSPRLCPDAATLRTRHGDDLELSERTMPNGALLVGQTWSSILDDRWKSTVTIWATRHDYCCVADIPGDFPPTAEQVDFVASLCDQMGSPGAAPPL